MKKTKLYKLPNGLKLVIHADSTRHSINANLITLFGGINASYLKDGKCHNIPSGVAHFLEHLLIEHSFKGNIYEYFSNRDVRFNGSTGNQSTNFFIDTVSDFDELLHDLIYMVNKAEFTPEDVDYTRKAVLEEVRKSDDNRFRQFSKVTRSCLFKNYTSELPIGTLRDVSEMSYENLKLCHSLFYRPENQLLAITGNVKPDEIKKLVTDIYASLDYKQLNVTSFIPDEDVSVAKESGELKWDTADEYVALNYKIDMSNYKPYDRLKLEYYIGFFLEYNFNESSLAYDEVLTKKISNYSINFDSYILKNFFVISIGCFTSDFSEFISIADQKIKELFISEEYFNLLKNDAIIKFLLREDGNTKVISAFVDNILSIGYEKPDTIEDIENLSYLECNEMLNKIDFSNKCITKIIKEN